MSRQASPPLPAFPKRRASPNGSPLARDRVSPSGLRTRGLSVRESFRAPGEFPQVFGSSSRDLSSSNGGGSVSEDESPNDASVKLVQFQMPESVCGGLIGMPSRAGSNPHAGNLFCTKTNCSTQSHKENKFSVQKGFIYIRGPFKSQALCSPCLDPSKISEVTTMNILSERRGIMVWKSNSFVLCLKV